MKVSFVNKLTAVFVLTAAMTACVDQSAISNPDPRESLDVAANVSTALQGAAVSSAPLGQSFGQAPGEPLAITPRSRDNGRFVFVEAGPRNAAPQSVGRFGLSDENSFEAVSQRETIESDAQRRAAVAAQYQIVQPKALSVKKGVAGPNLLAYALEAKHPKGTARFKRSYFVRENTSRENCARFGSPDEAQRNFLLNGGPQNDPNNLDYDGDGFACNWDPAPYIALAGTVKR